MKKYHINPETGRAGQCTATVKGCKFAVNGDIPEHYDSKEDAKKAYEEKMDFKATGTLKKEKSTPAQSVENIVSDADMVFKHYNGVSLNYAAKKVISKNLEKNRYNLKKHLDKVSDSLEKSDLNKDDLDSLNEDLKYKRRAVTMANDALAILDENSLVKPERGINVKDYSGFNAVTVEEKTKNDKALSEALENFVDSEYDNDGNTRYKGVENVSDHVRYDETDYVRLDSKKGVYANQPYSFRIQVGKELDKAEAEKLAQLVGYRYASTGGERGNHFVQDSPNSIVYYADTTKGRAYKKVDEFIEDLPTVVEKGSPVRKTDKSGPNTAGTRLVDGLGDLNYVEIYADNSYDMD